MTHPGVLLKTHGLHASKRRGQNFLCQPATASAIARAAGIQAGDVVLEIGAGLGALTCACAELAARVVALEVDRGLHAVLAGLLAERGIANVDLRLADALDLDWPAIAAEAGGPLVVVGNLPYAISSPLLFNLLENRALWRSATLMVQREVATRLLAAPGGKDYGRLTVLMQTWLEARPGMVVGPEQFFPRPAVDSQVLHLKPLEAPLVPLAGPAAEEWFSRVVKAAFSQRRKTLANSLAGGLNRPREEAAQAIAAAGLDPGRRAETLQPQELGRVAAALAPSMGQGVD
ncbi:MAG: ribosomal RNA small subunit methyltransferase A [Desulfarculus sp.]|nr:ribosomal RNA small subunit methyltransferase A [Desulfarculus sp.]